MLYSALRSVIAILLITPLLASAKVRGIFKSSLGLFFAYIVAIFAISVPLSFWPFENYFGGFNSVEQAMEYEHGKVAIQETVETETSILVFSDKSLDMIFKENGRYYLNSPINLTQTNGISEKGYFVVIYKDRVEPQSYVELKIFEGNKVPERISDNKGSKFEERFIKNGLVYYLGSFAYDDGSAYQLNIDGKEIDLKMFD